MKKGFAFRFGLVLICISFLALSVSVAQACDNAAERFWKLMEGVTLTADQYGALSNYVATSPIQSQDQLCSSLKAKWVEIKSGLLSDSLDNAMIYNFADLLNQFIANRTHFLAFLASILTPEQLDIFRGNVLDMVLEESKKGNILLRMIKVVHSAGLPLGVKSQLGDDWLRSLQGVVPLLAEMAGHRLALTLAIRENPKNIQAINAGLAALAPLRTQLVVNRIWFLLHMRNLIGADKMTTILENWEMIVHPDEE